MDVIWQAISAHTQSGESVMSVLRRIPIMAAALVAAVPVAVLLPSDGWALEEIVVTTRRREESLQDIPLSVKAITAEQIERLGIDNLFDIAQLDPSVSMDNQFSPADTRVAIRGLSNTRGRSNVAFLVDGIDVSTENVIAPGSGLLANMRLLGDVERIEIVKGPQSALYGRSAFAGAISYTTKNPTDEFEAKIGMDIAEYNQNQVNLSFSGPINEGLGYRVTGVAWKSNGFYHNSISGDDVGGGSGKGVAGTLVWEPSEEVRVKSRLSYSNDKYDPRPQVKVAARDLRLFPQEAIDAELGGAGGSGFWLFRRVSTIDSSPPGPCPGVPEGQPCNPDYATDFTGARGLSIVNHGRFCPDHPEPFDGGAPNSTRTDSPGYCGTKNIGDLTNPQTGKDYVVTHSENAFTGKDNDGFEQEVARLSVNADWDRPYGTFSLNSGYTFADEFDQHDQDYEAFGRPDRLLANWQAETITETTQLSLELRFASNFDGPVNFTVGYTAWEEWRDYDESNYIIACMPVARDRSAPDQNGVVDVQLDPREGSVVQVPGVCDGGIGGFPYPGETFGGPSTDSLVWQPLARAAAHGSATRVPPVDWDADTEHRSVYGMIEWQISEQWKLTAENRYVHEQFDLRKPNQSSCTELGFAVAPGVATSDPGTALNFAPMKDENGVLTMASGYETRCTWEDKDPPGTGGGVQDPQNSNNCDPAFDTAAEAELRARAALDPETEFKDSCWQYISGTESSYYNVPKVTLEWTPTDDLMVYGFYGKGQKPAGINQLISGGSSVTINEERFDEEEMDAYEIGFKSSFEWAGFWQVNAARFVQKYTDKQIGTQVIQNFRSTPRVINVDGGEVKGWEVEALWQPLWMEGLILTAAYTALDPEYTDFFDPTTSMVRAADGGNCPIVYFDGNNNIVKDADPDAPGFELLGYTPKCNLNLSGNDFEKAARNAFVATVNIVRPFGDSGMDWMFDMNTSYQDKRFLDADNYAYLDEYWLTNMSLGLAGDNWEAMIYVNNVFDDDVIKTASSSPDFGQGVISLGFTAGLGVNNLSATLPDPRVWGIRGNYRFGGD
jgi:outer membrane receptor protein involved in Fe transport